MSFRTYVGALLAAPVLVAVTATPGHAAGDAMVAFRGTVTVTPTATATPTVLPFCFGSLACGNGATPTGTVLGASVQPTTIDGLRGTATYTEVCAADTGLAPTGTATIIASVHDASTSSWSRNLSAKWTRVGLVAVIEGEASGVALFVPQASTQPPACGHAVPVDVIGAVQLAY